MAQEPASVGDVIEGRRIVEMIRRAPHEHSIRSVLMWCARWVVQVGDVDLSPLSASSRVDALDQLLTPMEAVKLAVAIVDCVGLRTDQYAAAEQYIKLIWSGGCECRACKGLAPSDPLCLREPIDAHVRWLVDTWWTIKDEPTLGAPYWMHQVKTLSSVEQARRSTAARNKEEKRALWREKLKDRGLMR